MTPIGIGLDDFVLRIIQVAYLAGEIRKTRDCLEDMARAGLLDADVENIITHADTIEKASSRSNTHYVIRGTSTRGVKVTCKVCSNYHPQTNKFIEWKLTSFSLNRGLQS